MELLETGGLIVSDNVLFRGGMVASDKLVVRRKKDHSKAIEKLSKIY